MNDKDKIHVDYISSRGEKLLYVPETDNYMFCVVTKGLNKLIINDKYVDCQNQSICACDDGIKLMMCDFIMQGKTLSLSLQVEDKYNYYVDGNLFDKKFLVYFIRNHYFDEFKQTFGEDTPVHLIDDYELNIVDDCVNMTRLTSQDAIKVHALSFSYLIPITDQGTVNRASQ